MAATLQFNLTGGASNSNPALALGGTHSSVQLSATALNNLFDNVSPSEASAGDIEYRAIDVTNVGNATATSAAMYMSTDTSSTSTELDFGMVASPINSVESIANESTAPATVSFAHYNSGSKLTLPDIAAGSYCRLWVRRTVTAGATNTSSDQGTLAVDYA